MSNQHDSWIVRNTYEHYVVAYSVFTREESLELKITKFYSDVIPERREVSSVECFVTWKLNQKTQQKKN